MDMDIYHVYTYASTAWLSLQGIPLLVYPRYVLSFAQVATEGPEPPISDYTLYALRALGGLFLAIAAFALTIRIIAPPSQIPSPNEPRTALTTSTSTAPPSLGSSILPLTTLLHVATAAWAYRQYMELNSTAWFGELVGACLIAFMGISAMLFGDESRPGRGSRWPFESREQRDQRKGKWEDRKEKIKKGL